MLGRQVTAVLAATLALLGLPAGAGAAKQIKASTVWRFDAMSYTIDQGEALSFLNADAASPGPHDVTADGMGADGKPLFQSKTVPHGEEVPVTGGQQLKTGSYPFHCSVHSFMTATLTVTDKGTPAGSGAPPPATSPPPPPAPAPAPSADTTKPKLKVGVGAAKLGAKRFSALVTIDEPAKLAIGLTARVGSRNIAVGRTTATTEDINERLAFAIKPSAAARKALGKARRAVFTLTVVATDAAGNAGRATARRMLRR